MFDLTDDDVKRMLKEREKGLEQLARVIITAIEEDAKVQSGHESTDIGIIAEDKDKDK